ncbi:hypothetical protein KEM54_000899 [Ascosphaera aggregata]|nr:hypothetical protein KEM54_000899 [Ascosphaera aggregata]
MPAILSSPPLNEAASIIKFTGCVIPHNKELVWKDIWIDSTSGKILQDQQVFYDYCMSPAEVIDLGGRILAPGFIDSQLNGAYGFDFSMPQENSKTYDAALRDVNRQLIQTGVTSYIPTVVSQQPGAYQKVLPSLGPSGGPRRAEDGAESLGAHVEGPFINPRKNGCHNKSLLQEARTGIDDLINCYGAKNLLADPYTGRLPPIRMITVAPELGCMSSLIPGLADQGTVVAIGHSDATYEQGMAAIAAGSTMVTHMFNAMRPFTHRSPGLFGLLGQDELPRPYYGLISDGIHLHPTSIQIAYKNHPEGAILVTDAMKLAGMPDGEYDWMNGDRIVKRGSKLTLAGTDRIAGSSAQLIQCLNNFRLWSGANTAQAIATVTETPAKMMRLEGIKGSLRPGADADFVVLADCIDSVSGLPRLTVDQVWKFGKKVVDRDSEGNDLLTVMH